MEVWPAYCLNIYRCKSRWQDVEKGREGFKGFDILQLAIRFIMQFILNRQGTVNFDTNY